MINLFIIVYDISGVKTYVNELSAYLISKEGVSVYLVYLNYKGSQEFRIQEHNEINSVYIPEIVAGNFEKNYYKRAAQLVYARFQNLHNVIFHANAPEQFSFAEEVKRLFNCPVVFTFHFLESFLSYIDYMDLYNQSNQIEGNVLPGMMLNFSDHIICVTKFARRIVEKYYCIKSDKTTVIYNGRHVTNKILEFISKSELKLKNGFKANDKILLFAGRIQESKGIAELIKAFLLIKDEYINLKLVIAGSGEFDKYLPFAQECPGRICFTGNLNYEKLTEFYQLADIGIIPSQYEQGAYVAIEMLQNNLPTIVSDVPGLNEMVIHGETGLVCSVLPGSGDNKSLQVDVNELVYQIRYLLENPVIARQISQSARIENGTGKGFSVYTMGEETLRIYYRLIENKIEIKKRILEIDK